MEWNCVPGLKEAVMLATNRFNWKPVRTLLEASVPNNSVEYKQLMEIKRSDELYENAHYENANIVFESCKKGYTEIMRVFLNSGLSPNYIVKNLTLLHYAALNGHLPLVKLLLNFGADCNFKPCYGETPLHWAVINGHFDVVKHLIGAGADVNTVNVEVLDALYQSDDLEKMLQFLLDSGYSLNLISCCLYSPSWYNNTKYLKVLLDAGTPVNGTDTRIPLHEAARFGYIHVMQLLLDYGADINITDKYGDTALHQAVEFRNLQSVKFLRDRGNLINSVNNNLETPLSLSVKYGKFDIAMLLLNSCAGSNLVLHDTVLNEAVRGTAPVKLLECLLEHGANVATVYYHNTALQNIIFHSSLAMSNDWKLHVVKLLLIYGSNHYVEDYHGNTVLHWACEIGDLELVKYLIDYGLNVDAKNREAEKPYDIAREKGHTNIVKAIIHYHCNKYTSF